MVTVNGGEGNIINCHYNSEVLSHMIIRDDVRMRTEALFEDSYTIT